MQNSIIVSITATMSLNYFALFLIASILVNSCLADTPSANIFITKSGIPIELDYIRPYIQLADEPNLQYMIFEYNSTSNSLFSFHRIMKLPDPSVRSTITLNPNVTRYGGLYYAVSNVSIAKLENGDTFLFDIDDKYSLIGAFGDALDLHPIHHPIHEVFINHYITTPIADIDPDIKPSPKPKTCTRTYEFSLHVISDPSMCERFGLGKTTIFFMIEQFIFQSKKMFMDLACIDIHFTGIKSYCGSTSRLNFERQDCVTTNSNEAECRTPLTKHIMQTMKSFPTKFHEGKREFFLFISGLNSSGSLAGLAYKSRACELRLSDIWIKGLSRIAFYHEIGHLLGANHVDEGIMKPNADTTEAIHFANRSYDEINHFIEKDSRSWCLRRIYSTTQADVLNDGWVQMPFLLPTGIPVQYMEFESISITPFSSERTPDVMFLISKRYFLETDPTPKLFYGSVRNIWSRPRSSGEEEIRFRTVGLEFSGRFQNFSLHFFTANRSESRGVVLSYLHYADMNMRSPVPYYRVGYVKKNGDIDIDSWSAERVIGKVDRFAPVNDFDIDMNIGNIRNDHSVDLVYMQLNAETDTDFLGTPFERKKTLKYKIGFNLSAIGVVQGGWSDYVTIQDEFSAAVGISGSIMDVDGNGKLDLVIYVVERGSYSRPRGYSYFRVGKDLNSDGIVEGGWTDHKMTYMGYSSAEQHSMDVAHDFESGHPVLISTQRLLSVDGTKSTVQRKVELSFSNKDVFKQVMATAKTYSAIETVSDNCEICYNDNLEGKEECHRKLNLCKSQIDELRIQQSPPTETILSSRMKNSYGLFGHKSQEFKNTSSDYFPKGTNRNNLNTSSSIYCTGFQSFLSQDDVCDTIDAKSVYSRGLEITFTNYLNEDILQSDINSTSLFEDTLGTQGNGAPILVQAEIRGIEKPTKKKIKNALRKVRVRKQIPSIKDLTWKKLIKIKRVWNIYRKVWIITFAFRANIEDIF